MGSKILFIEDELSNINGTILDALLESKFISGKEYNDLVKAKTIHDFNDVLSKAQINFIEFAESFKDAQARVEKAGSGADYRWFFIDRNLQRYSDIIGYYQHESVTSESSQTHNDECDSKKLFDKAFFNYFEHNQGDYLYIRLLQNGVSTEKVCFLTAYDLSNTPFQSSEFFPASGSEHPQIIDKVNQFGLINALKFSWTVKTRFKYKKIFGNQKIKALLGRKMEEFIELLARSEYPEGAAGFKFDEGDGTLLRNMIEGIVALLSQSKVLQDTEISVRRFLNDFNNRYMYNFYYKYDLDFPIFNIGQEWRNITQSLQHFPQPGDKTAIKAQLKKVPPLNYPKKQNLDKHLSYYSRDQKRQDQWLNLYNSADHDFKIYSGLDDESKKDFIVEKIIQYTTTFFVYVLTQLYFTSPQDPDLPPKHIFSYIDNIYTVTSEWSAHGGNPTRVTDLSAEGFRSLVYGMCQILDWLADKYPNQSDCNENNQ